MYIVLAGYHLSRLCWWAMSRWKVVFDPALGLPMLPDRLSVAMCCNLNKLSESLLAWCCLQQVEMCLGSNVCCQCLSAGLMYYMCAALSAQCLLYRV